MTVGIIVEGQEESQSLAHITAKITIEGVIIRKPLYAPIEPKATPGQIAKALESRLKILGVIDRVLILIDLENLDACPGERAQVLEQAVRKMGYDNIHVIIKQHKFENWLLADCDALQQLTNFTLTKTFVRQVTGKADSIPDAVRLLSSVKNDKRSFHKTQDGTAVARKANPETIALHSRSFRRFLHLLTHPLYRNQSRKAVPIQQNPATN